MGGTTVGGKRRDLTFHPQPWRTAVAALVILVLAYLGFRLAPVYFLNLEFQRHLESLASDPKSVDTPDERLRVVVVNRAAHIGLPVKLEQVRLRRSARGLRIEVRYTVPVDLGLYTVDLHFTPRAGSL